jgi:hypothetical protein
MLQSRALVPADCAAHALWEQDLQKAIEEIGTKTWSLPPPICRKTRSKPLRRASSTATEAAHPPMSIASVRPPLSHGGHSCVVRVVGSTRRLAFKPYCFSSAVCDDHARDTRETPFALVLFRPPRQYGAIACYRFHRGRVLDRDRAGLCSDAHLRCS